MATLSVVSTHQGRGVRVRLVSEDGRVHHDTQYRNSVERLWHGLRWSFLTTRGVSSILVDGREISRSEVIERLWEYLDGMVGGGDPWFLRLTDEIIVSLRIGGERRGCLKREGCEQLGAGGDDGEQSVVLVSS